MPIVISFLYKDIGINDKKKRNFLVVCGLILFLFMGLRSRYLGSTDTQNYYNMMKVAIGCDSWREYYNKDGVEVGFQMFTFLLSRIFTNPHALIIASSAIFVISVCFFIYRNSKDVAFSLVMYITLGLMLFEMQGMRQAIAMSICLFAYEFVKKRKLIPFLLCIAFAMTFHITAMVFVVVFFVSMIPYNLLNMVILTVISVVMTFTADNLVQFANEIFNMDYDNTVYESGGLVATSIYLLIIVFAVVVSKNMKNCKNESSMFYVLCMGMVCFAMRYVGANIAERISFYFMFAQLIVLPNSIAYLKQRDRLLIKLIVYILMVCLFAYRLSTGEKFLPYEFYWMN